MSKNHLIIQISENFCSLSELKNGEISSINSLLFEGKKDFQYKEQLKLFCDENIKQEYDEISVSWLTPNALLVPSNIFDPKEIESLFSTCFSKQVSKAELDYNRLMESSLVTIYEIPLWLKSFFIIRFPRVIIQHEYSHQIRGMLKSNASNLKIEVSVFPDLMILTFVDKNEVILCNSYEISHLNDVIYYLSFALQQKDLIQTKGKLNFSIHTFSNIKETDLSENLKKIDLFNQNYFASNQVTFNNTQTLKFQEFCV